MAREGTVLIEPDDFQPQPRPLEVILELVQLLEHAVVDEFCAGKIHDHVIAFLEAQPLDLPTKGNPITEDRRAAGVDLYGLVAKVIDLEEWLEHGGQWQAVHEVHKQFYSYSDQYPNE